MQKTLDSSKQNSSLEKSSSSEKEPSISKQSSKSSSKNSDPSYSHSSGKSKNNTDSGFYSIEIGNWTTEEPNYRPYLSQTNFVGYSNLTDDSLENENAKKLSKLLWKSSVFQHVKGLFIFLNFFNII